MSVTVNFVGCGKLGKTLGKLLVQNQLAVINGIVNTTWQSANEAIKFIGSGKAYSSVEELPPASIIIIGTPDDSIPAAAEKLAGLKHANETIIVHLSGVKSSDALIVLQQKNCATASLHLAKSVASPAESVAQFSGTHCAIEGDDIAVKKLSYLFDKMGARVFQMDKHLKKIYHLACVLSNNFLITLHYHALQCYLTAGLNESTAKELITSLMNDGLTNLASLSYSDALTGPLQRGDVNTIETHLQTLNELKLEHPFYIYQTLGKATLPLTHLTKSQRDALINALNAPFKRE